MANKTDTRRRDFLKKAAYVAPAILTLSAIPSIAQSGSGAYQTPTGEHCDRPRRFSPRRFTRHRRFW